MKRLLFLIFLLSIKSQLYSQQTYADTLIKDLGFKRHFIIEKKDTLHFISTISKMTSPKPTVVFVQGSLGMPLIMYDSNGIAPVPPLSMEPYREQFNIVIISRRGLPLAAPHSQIRRGIGYTLKNGDIPTQYILNDNLGSRVRDLGMVVEYLKKQKWVKSDSIFLLGHSEGYRVVAKYSSTAKAVRKIACLSANPFSRLRDEEIALRKKSMIYDTNLPFDSLCQTKIDSLHNLFLQNWSHPKVTFKDEEWDAMFKYNWLSYLQDIPYTNLLKCNMPILVAYGSKDLGSLDNDLLPYIFAANNKKNLTLKVYPNLEHSFLKNEYNEKGELVNQDFLLDKVFKDVLEWFLKK